jgi:tryprostatin B 6-hydroxylase
MACALYMLTKQPELANKLREELAPLIPQSTNEPILDDQIANNDYLNGIISESLRMYPPSPSHPTRITPPGGTVISGRFIPGGTQLMTPQYVIGRGMFFAAQNPST